MKFYAFVIRRVVLAFIALLSLTVITFLLTRAGGPSMIIAPYINPHLPYNAQKNALYAQFHLNQPVYIQYFYYLQGILKGDWGNTRTPIYSGSVISAITIFMPNTIQLALVSFLIAIFIAFPLGKISAVRKDSYIDEGTRIMAFVGISMPIFWLAELLMVGFATSDVSPYLNIFPMSGTVNSALLYNVPWVSNGISSPTHIMMIDALIHGNIPIFLSSVRHVILPAAALAFGTVAIITRYLRSSMIDVLNQEYIKTARAKGIPERAVINIHATKNAMIPVTTILGLLFAGLLSGTVVIETIFDYPGMGYWTVQAVLSGDTGGILGSTLIYGIILIVANFVVDILYAFLDPRIKLGD